MPNTLTGSLSSDPPPGLLTVRDSRCVLPQVVLPLLGADLRDGAAVGAGAGGGVTAKEALVKGGSSASFTKGQQEMSEAEGRWEEYRSLVSGGATQVTGTTGAMVTSDTFRTTRAAGAAREVAGARAGAGAVSEAFLRSYFTEVSAGFSVWGKLHLYVDVMLLGKSCSWI